MLLLALANRNNSPPKDEQNMKEGNVTWFKWHSNYLYIIVKINDKKYDKKYIVLKIDTKVIK